MYSRESTNTLDIGPRKAEELLRCNTFDGQRPLNKLWVQYLANEINVGRFVKGHVALAKNCKSDEQMIMNGQHQLHACLLSGKVITVTLDFYRYETNDDLWHLYGSFDVHKGRTERHIIKGGRGLLKSEELHTVPIATLVACGGALVWLGGGTKAAITAKAMNKCTKMELVEKYAKDVVWINDMCRNHPKGRCPAMAIVAAMIATHRTNEDKADEFWPRVIGGHDLVRNSPEWRLHGVINAGVSGANVVSGKNKNWRMYALCISWWNSFITEDGRSSVKVESMKSLPEVMG